MNSDFHIRQSKLKYGDEDMQFPYAKEPVMFNHLCKMSARATI